MSMISVPLTAGTWYEVVDLDDPTEALVYIDSTDDVIAAFEAGMPTAGTTGFACDKAMNAYRIPFGKSLWLKLVSGAANVIYSQFDGIMIDQSKCAYGRSNTITIDETVTGVQPVIGFDDSEADPITYVGLLHTDPAGIAAVATIDSAVMTLQFAQFNFGRTIRLYGIESDTSITSGLGTFETLAVDPTLTTAFVDVTLDNSGSAQIDLTALIQEIVDDVAGWDTTSPLQFWIGDIGGVPTSGNNETAVLIIAGRSCALYVRTS